MFLFCDVVSRDQMIKWTCDLISRSPSTIVTNVQREMFIGHVEVEITSFLSRDQRVMGLDQLEPLIVSYYYLSA